VLVLDERFVVHAEHGDAWEHVQRIRLHEDDVHDAVDVARSVMQETGASIASWWLSEHATPPDVEEQLLARGLTIVDGDYLIDGMLLTREPPPGPPDVAARPIGSADELAEAGALQHEVFATPAEQRTRTPADEFERLCGTEHEQVYAAWVDGRLAGAGRSYFTPRGVMMAGGATAGWARGRGAYRALVRARWDDAVAHGTPALAVHAKDTPRRSSPASASRKRSSSVGCRTYPLRDDRRERDLPALRRRDGVAHRDVAVPEVPVQARLLRGRVGRLSRPRLEALDGAGYDPRSGELLVALVWLVLLQLPIGADELNAARRRAMFVLAAGGDPHRELDFNSVAAARLAGELDTPERRAALAAALERLDAEGLPTVAAGLKALRAEPDLAWRTLGLALLADELADE
jgi:hypothetical protein